MIRSVLTVLRGSVLAQAMGLAVLPLLSRTFGPEAFGLFQVYLSAMMFLIIISAGRYEVAILRAQDDLETANVVALCIYIIFINTIILLAALFFTNELIDVGIKVFAQFPWWIMPVSMLLSGFMLVTGYLANRESSYDQIANSKTAQGLASSAVSAGIGLTVPVSSGLAIGDLVGRFANVAWLLPKQLHIFRAAARSEMGEIRKVAAKFNDLPTISLIGALLGTAGTALAPIVMFGAFSPHIAGQFGLADRAVGLPIAFIVIAVSQVHMGNLSQDLKSRTGKARNKFIKLSIILTIVALPIAIIGIFFSETLFRFVFGSGWEEAARFARIMAPAYFFLLISGGLNMTLTILGHQKTQLAWDVSRLGALVALWSIAPGADWSIEAVIAAHSAVLSIFAILHMALCFRALPEFAFDSAPILVSSESKVGGGPAE